MITKFGEIIGVNKPVLIVFYSGWVAQGSNSETLKGVATTLGDKAKIIKIDIKRNDVLAEALKVNVNPTFMIYKDGEMVLRETGEQDVNTLIGLVQQYL